MSTVTVSAVGDVMTGFDPPEMSFAHVLEALRSADVRFAQVERCYTERGSFQEQTGSRSTRQHPRMASAFKSVPFDVLSLASNHTGDWGPESVEDTLDTFKSLDIATIGAGRNDIEARRPAIITCNGIRIAFLGYVSVTPPRSWASETRAGSAPMRAHTFYEPYEFQAGAPVRVVTQPHERDLENLVNDVKAVRKNADFVFVSFHWGVHFTSRPCDYQIVVAHAAIDAGANVILGHHPHQPQGIELYKNSVILYSIGNFCVHRSPTHKGGSGYCQPNGEYSFHQAYSVEPEPGTFYDYDRHYKESAIAFIEIDERGLERITYAPTLMNDVGQPEIIPPGHVQFDKSLAYLNWAGNFIRGGLTEIRAVGDRYELYKRASA